MSNYSIGSIPLSIIKSKTHAIKENGKAKTPDWLETGWLLSQFAKGEREAIKNYKNFVEKIDIQALENPEKDLTGGFILGTPDFVNRVKEMMQLLNKLWIFVYPPQPAHFSTFVGVRPARHPAGGFIEPRAQ